MAGGAQDALADAGGAVADLFGAQGAKASAQSYGEAATIAGQNVELTQQATAIQQTLNTRQIAQTIGTQEAQVGGAGFAESGSALDILRSSVSNGALTKAMTAEQGAITENAYAEQQGLYQGLASSAQSSATGQEIGGVLQAGGAAYNAYGVVKNAIGAGGSTGTGAVASGVTDSSAAGIAAAGDTGAVAAGDAALSAGVADTTGAGLAAAGDTAAAAAGGSDIIGTIATVAAAWIICTELHRQGRMPSRIYYRAAPAFARYPERGKRGYYVWAIPSTRHLREHPYSLYSRMLCAVFNKRAEHLAGQRSFAGAALTHGLYAACWTISWFVPQRFADWKASCRT